MRSEIGGGRTSAQDSTSAYYMHKMLLELKKPQASDITPVFRLTKAKKITNGVVVSQSLDNLAAVAGSKNSSAPQSPKMHKVKLFEYQNKNRVSQE